jgi:hypothetical protein
MPVINLGASIYTNTAGTTVGTGDWYTIPVNHGDLSWQAVLTASSVGATAGSTVTVQVSNTTSVAVTTSVQTIALTCTTDVVTNGGTLFGSTLQGNWKYIRAVLGSLTTSTAGSAGSPSVSVYVYAGKRG